MTPTLSTRRLLLRPYVPGDEDDFAALFGDDQVTRWMSMPEGDARALFRRSLEPGRVTWDIWAVHESGVYVGHAEIKPSPDPRVDGHEVVYALLPGAWGRGLGSEVAEAVTEYGIGALQLPHVHATVAKGNAASLRLLGKLGYEHVGDLDEDDGTVVLLLTRRA